MQGVNESFRNKWYVMLAVFSVVIITPLVPEGFATFDDDLVPPSVNGLPWWAFKVILLCVVPFLITASTAASIPDEYPIDQQMIAQKGIDPDTIELNKEETARRDSYDAPNMLIRHRRQSVAKQMQELGLMEEEEPEKTPLTRNQLRLSSIIMGLPEPEDTCDLSPEEAPAEVRYVKRDDSSASGFEIGL